MSKVRIGLFLMSARGLKVLRHLIEHHGADVVAYVVTARDPAMQEDFHDLICSVAREAGLPVYERNALPDSPPSETLRLAVAWRWLLPNDPARPLVVFHDSLLPRYRGFAPLVAALVNGDSTIGVTALLAGTDYDAGPVLARELTTVRYPLRIADAIEQISPCYTRLTSRLIDQAAEGPLCGAPQDEQLATYSLWRDENDYLIDWSSDSSRIQRFVDATGFPYRGASTFAANRKLRVVSGFALADVHIENRASGKVIFVREGRPVVVCGVGLFQVDELVDDLTRKSVLPLKKFRTRFSSFPSRDTPT